MCFISARTLRPLAAFSRLFSNLSLVYLPCRRLASDIRARPSSVLGPVLAPPCNLQRSLFLLAGRWHSVPFLVLAPHRLPGQSAPKRHSTPMVTLSFVSIQNTPNMRYYYTAYLLGSKEGDYYAEYQARRVQSRLSAPRFCDFAGTFMVE